MEDPRLLVRSTNIKESTPSTRTALGSAWPVETHSEFYFDTLAATPKHLLIVWRDRIDGGSKAFGP
jgi:hypothetical protein